MRDTAARVWDDPVGEAERAGRAGLEWGESIYGSAEELFDYYVSTSPERLLRVMVYLEEGDPLYVRHFIEALKRPGDLRQIFVEGLKAKAVWAGQLIARLVDVVGAGEVATLLSEIVKTNTRRLTAVERAEADIVFQGSINYDVVRIDENSLVAFIGKWSEGSDNMAVTTFHTINATEPIGGAAGSSAMGWLVHELTHVAQYQAYGSWYMPEAFHAQQFGDGYDYEETALDTQHYRDFNPEQQAEIAEAYYEREIYESTHPEHARYQPHIEALRNGNL